MKSSKQNNAILNQEDLVRLYNSKSPRDIKKHKPVNFSSKKLSILQETRPLLMPTSSSTFKCEPAEECNILANSSEGAVGRKKRNFEFKPRNLKVKPFIVKMTRPTNYTTHEVVNILDGKSVPEHLEADVDLLKSLTSGCTDNYSNVKNVDSRKVFLDNVWFEKSQCAKKQTPHDKSGFKHSNLLKDVSNLTILEDKNSFDDRSPDHFIIDSVHVSCNEIAHVYKINHSKFLFSMNPGKQLYFVGIFDLELLRGCVEILGYSANKPLDKLLTVYSCLGSSHLFLKASSSKTHSAEDTTGNLLTKMLSLGLSMASSQEILKENSVLFLLNRSSGVRSVVWSMLLENHLSFSLFPPVHLLRKDLKSSHNIMERSIGCICQENLLDLGYKEFIEVPNLSEIEENILCKDVFKTVLCGGKSVGKSTLLRYLVNKSLQKWESVLVIDCDLGQCEFTPSGCVSVTLVDQPLLGPNYTHLKEPLRCVYLGEIDVTKCPESYIKGYKWLIDYAKQEHGNIPWLINTMGFTRGFGAMVACNIIKIVNPSQVIQIESKNRKLNFPNRLDPGYVYSQNTEAFSGLPESLNYNLYVIPSGSESGGFVKSRCLSPAESRNIVMLFYFSEMLSSDVLNLSQVLPHKIGMDLLELQITNKYSLDKMQIAAAMNGNLVALCSSNENDLFPNCLGFGIVRAIDWQTNTIYLITPMPANSLRKVNCLLKGNVALPETLYFNQGGVEGVIPYLAVTSGNATARFAKRDFRSLPATATISGTSK